MKKIVIYRVNDAPKMRTVFGGSNASRPLDDRLAGMPARLRLPLLDVADGRSVTETARKYRLSNTQVENGLFSEAVALLRLTLRRTRPSRKIRR